MEMSGDGGKVMSKRSVELMRYTHYFKRRELSIKVSTKDCERRHFKYFQR